VRRTAIRVVAAVGMLLATPPAIARTPGVQRFLEASDPVAMAWTPDGTRPFFDERATGDIRAAMPDG
jgi:hypothetical protein